jgi:hypothetical protein
LDSVILAIAAKPLVWVISEPVTWANTASASSFCMTGGAGFIYLTHGGAGLRSSPRWSMACGAGLSSRAVFCLVPLLRLQ